MIPELCHASRRRAFGLGGIGADKAFANQACSFTDRVIHTGLGAHAVCIGMLPGDSGVEVTGRAARHPDQ